MSEETLNKIGRAAVAAIAIAMAALLISGCVCVCAGLLEGAFTGEFPEWMRSK